MPSSPTANASTSSIDLATIEKGGSYLGMVSSIRPEDQFTRWRSEYEADIKVSLASLAGEREFFGGDSSSGVSSDLAGATTLATMMEGYWGMGSTVASHGVTHQLGVGGGGRPTGDDEHERELLQSAALGQRIEENLGRILDETVELVRQNRHEILAVAHALEQHKTLAGEDVVAVIEGTEGPLVDGRVYHDAVRAGGAGALPRDGHDGPPGPRPGRHRPPRADQRPPPGRQAWLSSR